MRTPRTPNNVVVVAKTRRKRQQKTIWPRRILCGLGLPCGQRVQRPKIARVGGIVNNIVGGAGVECEERGIGKDYVLAQVARHTDGRHDNRRKNNKNKIIEFFFLDRLSWLSFAKVEKKNLRMSIA